MFNKQNVHAPIIEFLFFFFKLKNMYIQKTAKCKVAQIISKSTKKERKAKT